MPNINNQDTVKKCWVVVFVILFLLLSLTSYVIYRNYQALVHEPMISSQAKPEIFEVKPNTTAKSFAHDLRARHWIRSSHVLLALIRWQGAASHLQAGIYQVNPGEPLMALLNRILKGDVLIQALRVGEGSTLADLTVQLEHAPYLTFNGADLKAIAATHPSAEGLLLADTYYYKAGSLSTSLLKQANQQLLTYLDHVWQARDPALPYHHAYELLIAASIIEKEASIPLERRVISGIIVNRIKKGMPLQMDPTIIYALQRPSHADRSLHHHDLSIDSPYNTYLHRGLPPTPIAMVSRQSLDAAANPEHSNYLYFYAKGDGSHQFSETYAAQRQAIQQYKPKNHHIGP